MIRYEQPVCGPLSTPPRWHLDGRTSPGGKPTAHRPVPRAEMSVAWNGRCRCWMERCWLEEEAPMLYPLACQTTMCPMQPAACESSQCLETLFSFSVHIWHKYTVFNELKLSEEAHVSFCRTLYLKYKSVSLSSGILCQVPVILGKQVLQQWKLLQNQKLSKWGQVSIKAGLLCSRGLKVIFICQRCNFERAWNHKRAGEEGGSRVQLNPTGAGIQWMDSTSNFEESPIISYLCPLY